MRGRVLVVCASRRRPELLREMEESVLSTSRQADVAVYLDDDTGATPEVGDRVTHVVGPRVGPCASLNALVRQFPGYDAYGAATDDSQFVTDGWDQWVIRTALSFPALIGTLSPHHAPPSEAFSLPGETLTRRDGLAFLAGGAQGARMDFPWVTRRWLEVVGWLACPDTYSFYWDVVVEAMGDMTQSAHATADEFEMIHREEGSINGERVAEDAKSAILTLAFGVRPIVHRLRQEISRVDASALRT